MQATMRLWWLACVGMAAARAEWKPVEGRLLTRWATNVAPDAVWPEYPRPQMAREAWQHLNGLWDYAIVPKDTTRPERWDGKILVPFAVESALSGVGRTIGREHRLWYRRHFQVPAEWAGRHVLLHFGAVDWDAIVWVNGQKVGSHRGGYDAFSFDMTEALRPGNAEQEVVVSVWDPPTPAFSRAANNRSGPAAFGTQQSPAFGRRHGSNQCPPPISPN